MNVSETTHVAIGGIVAIFCSFIRSHAHSHCTACYARAVVRLLARSLTRGKMAKVRTSLMRLYKQIHPTVECGDDNEVDDERDYEM